MPYFKKYFSKSGMLDVFYKNNYTCFGFRVERNTPRKINSAAPTRIGVSESEPARIANIAASKGCK